MTCSFHKFGDYFPGTGDLNDKGKGVGKGYAVNYPLKDGIDDESYRSCFRPVSFLGYPFSSSTGGLSFDIECTDYQSDYGLVQTWCSCTAVRS